MIEKLRQFLFGDPPKWEEYGRKEFDDGNITILFFDKNKGKFKKEFIYKNKLDD